MSEPVTILIAEDSLTQALALRHMLEQNRFEVMVGANGKEAMERLRERRPTLVITDIHMPEMDGYELCRQIRNHETFSDLPVILLTTFSAPKDVLKGIECGADSFVVKPYDANVLLTRIRQLLAHLPPRRPIGNRTLIEINYDGENYAIDTGRANSIGLLLSTYEAAVEKNRQLSEAREQLQQKADELRHAHEEAHDAQERLNQVQVQLFHAEKLQIIGQLAAGISHEVKNPLQILQVGLQWLGDSALCQDALAGGVLSDMKDAVDRATLVIGDMLDFSAQHPLNIGQACINSLIEKTLRLVKHDLTVGKIRVVKQFAEDLPICRVDANRVLQVLINLLVNACHAMPNGGSLTIATSKRRMDADDGDYQAAACPEPRYRAGDTVVDVEIRDTGTGISEEHLSKILDPFFTTKPAGKGTGLGLAVTNQIIKSHRGILGIRNSPEGGAEVTITLTQTVPKN